MSVFHCVLRVRLYADNNCFVFCFRNLFEQLWFSKFVRSLKIVHIYGICFFFLHEILINNFRFVWQKIRGRCYTLPGTIKCKNM